MFASYSSSHLQMDPLVHPSEIWVRELRSKSTFAIWPPFVIISSFHRQYLRRGETVDIGHYRYYYNPSHL